MNSFRPRLWPVHLLRNGRLRQCRSEYQRIEEVQDEGGKQTWLTASATTWHIKRVESSPYWRMIDGQTNTARDCGLLSQTRRSAQLSLALVVGLSSPREVDNHKDNDGVWRWKGAPRH